MDPSFLFRSIFHGVFCKADNNPSLGIYLLLHLVPIRKGNDLLFHFRVFDNGRILISCTKILVRRKIAAHGNNGFLFRHGG